ncbi:hypothetical protein B0T21DRAFT_453336 [Apiosordaria backusii]|uniref:Uncharacterized protein n=1 Tax=Apiosordaria backusii TaxID=314023 RepID=A0AA40AXA3_9PEZI|nr:hypothetical protein B0T21DRAFT_453336 [Apiosordaria backusii]
MAKESGRKRDKLLKYFKFSSKSKKDPPVDEPKKENEEENGENEGGDEGEGSNKKTTTQEQRTEDSKQTSIHSVNHAGTSCLPPLTTNEYIPDYATRELYDEQYGRHVLRLGGNLKYEDKTPIDYLESELHNILAPLTGLGLRHNELWAGVQLRPWNLTTRLVLRKFWWAARGDLDLVKIMLEDALRFHYRMREICPYNQAYKFPKLLEDLAFVTTTKSDDPRRQVVVIWYRWGHAKDLGEVLRLNPQTLIAWRYVLIERALSLLNFQSVDHEPLLSKPDFYQIVQVHDPVLFGHLDRKDLATDSPTRAWMHIYDANFMMDRFYPGCFHPETFIIDYAHWLPVKWILTVLEQTGRSWTAMRSPEDFLALMPPGVYPNEYLPDHVSCKEGELVFETGWTPSIESGESDNLISANKKKQKKKVIVMHPKEADDFEPFGHMHNVGKPKPPIKYGVLPPKAEHIRTDSLYVESRDTTGLRDWLEHGEDSFDADSKDQANVQSAQGGRSGNTSEAGPSQPRNMMGKLIDHIRNRRLPDNAAADFGDEFWFNFEEQITNPEGKQPWHRERFGEDSWTTVAPVGLRPHWAPPPKVVTEPKPLKKPDTSRHARFAYPKDQPGSMTQAADGTWHPKTAADTGPEEGDVDKGKGKAVEGQEEGHQQGEDDDDGELRGGAGEEPLGRLEPLGDRNHWEDWNHWKGWNHWKDWNHWGNWDHWGDWNHWGDWDGRNTEHWTSGYRSTGSRTVRFIGHRRLSRQQLSDQQGTESSSDNPQGRLRGGAGEGDDGRRKNMWNKVKKGAKRAKAFVTGRPAQTTGTTGTAGTTKSTGTQTTGTSAAGQQGSEQPGTASGHPETPKRIAISHSSGPKNVAGTGQSGRSTNPPGVSKPIPSRGFRSKANMQSYEMTALPSRTNRQGGPAGPIASLPPTLRHRGAGLRENVEGMPGPSN